MNFLALHAGSVDKERHPLKLGVVIISDFIFAKNFGHRFIVVFRDAVVVSVHHDNRFII